jgi:hypothetical protein
VTILPSAFERCVTRTFLAVFLLGLWASSAGGSLLLRRIREPRLALAVCQILLAVSIAGTAYIAAHVLPFWLVEPALSLNPWFTFDLDVFRCIRTILLPTLLWGGPASRSLWRAPRLKAKTPRGSREKSMPRTQQALSPVPWHSVSSSFPR